MIKKYPAAIPTSLNGHQCPRDLVPKYSQPTLCTDDIFPLFFFFKKGQKTLKTEMHTVKHQCLASKYGIHVYQFRNKRVHIQFPS